jgi:murein DD-endopeptidase MepM/ murein hydrolase activator NlpD
MKIILFDPEKPQKIRNLTLAKPVKWTLLTLVLALPVVSAVGGFALARHLDSTMVPVEAMAAWEQELLQQQLELKRVQRVARNELEALTVRMARMQARLIRLDALGERVLNVAKLDENEFDFSQPPAMGGPVIDDQGEPYGPPEFIQVLDQLAQQIEDREQQLDIMAGLLVNRQLQNELSVTGTPVVKGWMSSKYGNRTDPFNGRRAWHNGVDFAGKLGSEVVAVASGVVTWSDKRSGYGLMVEINHGGGYVTRYAHCKENLVGVGEVVKKGQAIALMGSSGRSTGPHVHFEVYKNGKPENPAAYIARADRS